MMEFPLPQSRADKKKGGNTFVAFFREFNFFHIQTVLPFVLIPWVLKTLGQGILPIWSERPKKSKEFREMQPLHLCNVCYELALD